MDGKHLWPGITLARMLVECLRGLRVTVQHVKIAREDNLAHSIAKREQRRRYRADWVLIDDLWPDCMQVTWKDVFGMVARNRRSDWKVYDLPSSVIYDCILFSA